MDLLEDYSAYKKEEKLSEDAWIDQLSVHDRERPVQLISMYCLLINWMMQQNLPGIQLPVFDGSPTKWSELIMKIKNMVHDLQFLTYTQRMTSSCNIYKVKQRGQCSASQM